MQEIPFPKGGLYRGAIPSRQPLETTIDAANVVWESCRTGRGGGARAPGKRKYSPLIGANLRGAASLVHDTSVESYQVTNGEQLAYSEPGASKKDANSVKCDSEGNTFTLEGGTHVVVRNSEGVEQAALAIPVADTGQVCRALAIDDAGSFYVAVSEGGRQSIAKLWAYTNDALRGWEVLWSIETGLFIEKLEVWNSGLYGLGNDTDRGRAYVVQYNNLGTLGVEVGRSPVVAPANVLSISEKGRIAVGSGINADRALDPRHVGTGQVLLDDFASWTEENLTTWPQRRWAVFDPGELDLEDDESVFEWGDKNGSQRKFIQSTAPVTLKEIRVTLLVTFAGLANNDTLEFKRPDGTLIETYRLRTGGAGLAQANDVLIGADAGATIDNIELAIEQGGAPNPTVVYYSTQPSTLAFLSNDSAGVATAFCHLRANQQAPAVIVTVVSPGGGLALDFTSLSAGTVLAGQIRPSSAVSPTAPKMKLNGMGGHAALFFDGVSSKMETLPNPNILASSKDEHHTFWPGWGNNISTSASARFASFLVFKPYPQDVRACVASQNVKLSSGGGTSWTRRIVSGRATDGSFSKDKVGIVERDGSTNRTFSADYTTFSNFNCVAQVSNPTGNVEVWKNGFPVGRANVAFTAGNIAGLQLTATGVGTQTGGVNPTHVILTAGTGLTLGVYAVASRLGNDDVVLATDPGPDVVDSSIVGTAVIATGTAVANDSVGPTVLGQSSVVAEDDEFWKGEINYAVVLADDSTPITEAERQLMEGRLAWRFGANQALPANHPYYSVPPPPVSVLTTQWYNARKALTTNPVLTVLDGRTGEIAWMAASDGTSSNPIGGIGYFVKWNSRGRLYTGGPPTVFATDPSSVRCIQDLVDSYSTATADGAWSAQIGSAATDTFTYDKLEADVDRFDNLYVPWNSDTYEDTDEPFLYLAYSSTGTRFLAPTDPAALMAQSVAVAKPELTFEGSSITRAQRLLVARRREWAMLVHIPLTFPGPSTSLLNLDGKGLIFGFEGAQQFFLFKIAPALSTDVLIGATRQECLQSLKTAMLAWEVANSPLYAVPTAIDTTVDPPTLRFVPRERIEGINPVTVSPDAGYVNAGNAPYGGGTLFFDTVEADTAAPSLFAYDLVESNAPTSETRRRTLVVVSEGDFATFSGSATAIPTNGAGFFDPNARYIQSTAGLGYTFTTDGNRIGYFSPKSGGEIKELKSATAGSFPKGVMGVEWWRGRLILFGLRDDPYAFFGAAVGDPFNADRAPAQPDLPTRAFLRPVGGAGAIDDIITGFIPYSDALKQGAEISAIILGDHSMYRLTGDPTAGGRLEPMSKTWGGAAGRAWCIGPRGEVYIWSQTGGVLVTSPGSAPQPFSNEGMAREFESVDLSSYYMRMAWDTRRKGLLVVACPYGGIDADSQMFFYEASAGAWWRESTAHRITDVVQVDADKPNDRDLLLLCADGYARTWDFSGGDDDGERLRSYVTIGPLHSGSDDVKVALLRLRAIIEHYDETMTLEVWGSDYSSSIGRMLKRFELEPGNSPLLSVRESAMFLWIILRGSRAWTFERLSVELDAGARV